MSLTFFMDNCLYVHMLLRVYTYMFHVLFLLGFFNFTFISKGIYKACECVV